MEKEKQKKKKLFSFVQLHGLSKILKGWIVKSIVI